MYWLEFAGEDDPFAALEATAAATDVTLLAPGIGTARALAPDRAAGLALTTAAGEVVGHTDASVASARALLETAVGDGSEANAPVGEGPETDAPVGEGPETDVAGDDGYDREGTVAVRARDVRGSANVDTQRAERELGGVLTDRGFEVDLDDPDHTLRALFASGELARDPAAKPESPLGVGESGLVDLEESDLIGVEEDADDADVCLLGWVDVERDAAFGNRAPTDRPFFQPGSMDPALARALVNLAGARPGATVVDPMCGTGGIVLEASLLGSRVVGVDAQSKMVRGTRENLRELAPGDANSEVVRGDARRLPLADDAADGLVVDVPYERQSAVAADDLDDLVEGALEAACDVAPRAIVVADRAWVGAAKSAGWAVKFVHQRRVHRSLNRSIHLLIREDQSLEL